MGLHIGGCSKRDQPMKRPLNFIDAPSVTILGAIMPSRLHKPKSELRELMHDYSLSTIAINISCKPSQYAIITFE
jgi:hypothetical protein